MTIKFVKTFPPFLKNSTWQKQKKFTEKVKADTKTGLGDRLKAAEAAWKLIPFAALDVRTAPKATDILQALKNVQTAQGILTGQVATTRTALQAAKTQADLAAKNMALSSASRSAADIIATGLETYDTYLKDIKLDDLEKVSNQFQATLRGEFELHTVVLKHKGKLIAKSTGANCAPVNKLTVSPLIWDKAITNPDLYVGEKISVTATRPDATAYQANVTLKKLSDDQRTAKLS